MDKFQNKYRIPSARAAWHKYDGGVYFVTICTAGRAHYLGEIAEGTMQLSDIGNIAKDCFAQVSVYYPYAEIPLFTIMPNHIHAIVIIDGNDGNDGCDGRDGRDGRDGCDGRDGRDGRGRDAINRVSTTTPTMTTTPTITTTAPMVATTPTTTPIPRNPMISQSLGTVIRGLKARISHAAHQYGIPFEWQTRFYDRIIRNNPEMNRIAEYIENNVAKWDMDELNKND